MASVMVFPKRCRCYLAELVFTGLLCLMVTSSFAIYSWGQTTGTVIHPVLRLEKPKYLLGESIRFWVGVEAEPPGVIPHDVRKACSLEITKPDGSSETQSIGWPLDGNPDMGWRGGGGFTAYGPGSYLLVLECGGNRTQQLPLIVEKDEIFNEVSAAFRFESSGLIQAGTSVPVVFSVTNNSPFPIRFPKRGVMMEGISLSVSREKPAYRSDFFYPWEKLSHSRFLQTPIHGTSPRSFPPSLWSPESISSSACYWKMHIVLTKRETIRSPFRPQCRF